MGSVAQRPQYIPVGCASFTKADAELSDEAWESLRSPVWRWFSIPALGKTDDLAPLHHENHLPAAQQQLLLRLPLFGNYIRLLREQWIQVEFRSDPTSDDTAVVRVYFLPDDARRGVIDRVNHKLSRSRLGVLRVLDYTRESWLGNRLPTNFGSPITVETQGSIETPDTTLLQLFNEIPSPKPEAGRVTNHDVREAMDDISQGNVPGLETKLYPYQRRSAATMLQKESQPDTVLDPRLLHVQGPDGYRWYLDPVAGTILNEPRMYDNVSGGILAEEMGSGKTVICLTVILATKHLTAAAPDSIGVSSRPVRKRIGSLLEMAASCATRNSVPWKRYFQESQTPESLEFGRCIEVLKNNPGYYLLPTPVPRRSGRNKDLDVSLPPTVKYLSATTLVIVPNNLLAQWKHEIKKHTSGLKVLILSKHVTVPFADDLLEYDVLLFAQSKFEQLVRDDPGFRTCPLSEIHFKRCLIDEGHVIGNSKMNRKSNLLMGLDCLSISSRWIVTGTPSQGLFGVEGQDFHTSPAAADAANQRAMEMEKRDLERIGSISALYLKSRPWANSVIEIGDTVADWGTYLMLPRHSAKARGRADCLRATLNSLIIRHRLDEVSDLLPSVDEKVVILDGSYQDQLSVNMFSMMIILNAVQSERKDRDYFFHPKQRKNLQQIVHNLKQTSFFGGSFFTAEEVQKAIETAEEFLREKKVYVSPADEELLNEAIQFGHLAAENSLRNLSNQFHEMPINAVGLPKSVRSAWSLDDGDGDTTCTTAGLLSALQRTLHNAAKQPEKLNALLNGGLVAEGFNQKFNILQSNETASKKPASSKDKAAGVLAGNTKLGSDSPRKSRASKPKVKEEEEGIDLVEDIDIGPLASTMVTSTVSAKLTYLIDNIMRHQQDEKIIIFYENNNVAWYLASVLDILQIQHLIYARGLTVERRSQYVNTFHYNETFRVLLMDLSQAAFGLDMRAASRIYFINPVLNPQVQAQAIGRVRRISQQKPVSVETLVLRGSLDEVILEHKQHMTQAEHRRVKSILDVRPIYNWIKNAKITVKAQDDEERIPDMVALQDALPVFGRGFGKPVNPDEGLVFEDGTPTKPSRANGKNVSRPATPVREQGLKRPLDNDAETQSSKPKRVQFGGGHGDGDHKDDGDHITGGLLSQPPRRVKFA